MGLFIQPFTMRVFDMHPNETISSREPSEIDQLLYIQHERLSTLHHAINVLREKMVPCLSPSQVASDQKSDVNPPPTTPISIQLAESIMKLRDLECEITDLITRCKL